MVHVDQTTIDPGVFSGRSSESPNPKEISLQEENRTTITPQTKASVPIESDSNTQYMIEIAKQKVKGFKAGQIANCVHQWKMLTSDPEILRYCPRGTYEWPSMSNHHKVVTHQFGFG